MSNAADPAPIENASAEAVRARLDAARPGEMTLLDVRMEPEYAEFHLPGARLVPLPDLPDRLGEIDRSKPVVVYCRSGKRSAAAAQILASAGFPRVVNLLGGAMAWQGAAAVGPPDAGLTLLSGNETPRAILRAALGMEAALGAFYKKQALAAEDGDAAATFTRLAVFEDRHLTHVHSLYDKETGQASDLDALLAAAAPELEGGLPADDFLAQLGGEPASAQEVLELAASVEAQAFDLYSRLAERAETPEAKAVYATLTQEEKAHLRAVGVLLARI